MEFSKVKKIIRHLQIIAPNFEMSSSLKQNLSTTHLNPTQNPLLLNGVHKPISKEYESH